MPHVILGAWCTLMWPMVDATLHLRHQVRSWACQVILRRLWSHYKTHGTLSTCQATYEMPHVILGAWCTLMWPMVDATLHLRHQVRSWACHVILRRPWSHYKTPGTLFTCQATYEMPHVLLGAWCTLMWPMVDATLHLRHQVRSWACQVILRRPWSHYKTPGTLFTCQATYEMPHVILGAWSTLMWPMVDATLHLRHQVRSWACQVILRRPWSHYKTPGTLSTCQATYEMPHVLLGAWCTLMWRMVHATLDRRHQVRSWACQVIIGRPWSHYKTPGTLYTCQATHEDAACAVRRLVYPHVAYGRCYASSDTAGAIMGLSGDPETALVTL